MHRNRIERSAIPGPHPVTTTLGRVKAAVGIAVLALGTPLLVGLSAGSASAAATAESRTGSRIAIGYSWSCAIQQSEGTGEGPLSCWGSNVYGQLGIGSTTSSPTPVQVGEDTDWVDVDAGTSHVCGVRAVDESGAGTLWCWGNNARAQLGDGTRTTRTRPVQIGEATNWVDVDAGDQHSCGVRSDGTLWCWGYNRLGQIGEGSFGAIQNRPLQVGSDTDWASVTAGYAHTCALRTDHTLWCWGDSTMGQTGTGKIGSEVAPAQVGDNSDWTGVSTGYAHTCGTRDNGTLWCWGENGYGQLGVSGTGQTSPVRVGDDDSWTAVGSGSDSVCALRTDGSVWCWGNNSGGQLGDGTTTHRFAPVRLSGDGTWASVAMGGPHGCAFDTDGALSCWGQNWSGQLGDGSTDPRTEPAPVAFGG